MKRDTRNAIRTILVLFFTAAIVAVALVVVASAAAAPPDDTRTCDKSGFPEANKVEGSDATITGPWGTVTADGTEVVFDVDAGIEVCIKAGPELVVVSSYEVLHLDHEVSHMSWRYTEPTPTETETVPPGECPSTAHGCTPPPPLPTRTETPSPTDTPTPTPSETKSPSPSSTPSPEPTEPTSSPSPSGPQTPSSPPSTPASPTPTVSPSDAPPSTPSETPPTEPTTAPTHTESFAPPADLSTPQSELAATGVAAWLLGAGAVVLSVLGAAFASFAGRMEDR